MSDRRMNLPTNRTPFSGGVLEDFRREMDNLFNGFFGHSMRPGAAAGLPQGVLSPAIDVSEGDKEITLTAELPGLSEDDVELTVSDGRLMLKGEKKIENDGGRNDRQYTERSYGAFQRMLPLPDRVDADNISARFDRGVLTVTMPKKPGAEGEGARRIEIAR